MKADGRTSIADATESRNASAGGRWAGMDLRGEGSWLQDACVISVVLCWWRAYGPWSAWWYGSSSFLVIKGYASSCSDKRTGISRVTCSVAFVLQTTESGCSPIKNTHACNNWRLSLSSGYVAGSLHSALQALVFWAARMAWEKGCSSPAFTSHSKEEVVWWCLLGQGW